MLAYIGVKQSSLLPFWWRFLWQYRTLSLCNGLFTLLIWKYKCFVSICFMYTVLCLYPQVGRRHCVSGLFSICHFILLFGFTGCKYLLALNFVYVGLANSHFWQVWRDVGPLNLGFGSPWKYTSATNHTQNCSGSWYLEFTGIFQTVTKKNLRLKIIKGIYIHVLIIWQVEV